MQLGAKTSIISTNYGRDKSRWPPRSRPKIEIGIFKPPGASRLSGLGSPDLLKKSGFQCDFSKLIETSWEKLRKLRYLDLSRLFRLLISATVLKNPDNTNYPGTKKVRIKQGNREMSRYRDFTRVPRFIPTCLN